jgi:probable F420-dependent oxidoreductase
MSASEVRAYVRRIGELGYDCFWVAETVGREPFTLLGALSETAGERLSLGTSIASIYGRDAVTTRGAAMTVHELTGGHFVTGLGVSHPHLVHKVRGHEFTRPVSTMRDYLAAYHAAPYRGPRLDVGDPPVLIAALRERMTELAATDADGAFPYLFSPERVRWMRELLDRVAAPKVEAGAEPPLLAVTLPVVLESDAETARATARIYLKPYLRTPTYQQSWALQGFTEEDWEKPGSDALVDAMVAWGDRATLLARIREMAEAGADHVALIPLSPEGVTEHLPTVEALGPAGESA